MLLPQIILMILLALLLRLLGHGEVRRWIIFISSAAAVFWLQPALPVRGLDFWLPTATLALAAFGWLLTSDSEQRGQRQNLVAGLALAGTVLLVGLTRYMGGGDWLAASRPPPAGMVAAGVAGLTAAAGGTALLLRGRAVARRWLLAAAVIFLVILLLGLKTPAAALALAREARALAGQNPDLAVGLDIRWLGFSYVCFRLIHTLRDRQAGRLAAVDLRTYVSYIVFFPAFVAGPIDRLERFAKEYCAPGSQPVPTGIVARAVPLMVDDRLEGDLTAAAPRLALGLLKKFALADTLSLVALSPANAGQVSEPGWLWLLLYAYAALIYLDFAGYTDIAIGMGLLLGIRLPENFAAPYRKSNLTQFWNAWHMSLTQWFRAYFFNPFVRWLRGTRGASPLVVLFLSQVLTMLLIGLWHGVTANFILWGAWHGLGLFAQNRWSDSTRGWFSRRLASNGAQSAARGLSTLLTFHYVALGWVWFALPTPGMALSVFARLFGFGGAP